jgi:hypothetical protein
MLEHMKTEGFVNDQVTDYFVVSGDPAELLEKLLAFTPPPSAASLEWAVSL